MVSFLSFPWNGSDPVSISNCRATQNGSKCSDQAHRPVDRPRSLVSYVRAPAHMLA